MKDLDDKCAKGVAAGCQEGKEESDVSLPSSFRGLGRRTDFLDLSCLLLLLPKLNSPLFILLLLDRLLFDNVGRVRRELGLFNRKVFLVQVLGVNVELRDEETTRLEVQFPGG